MYLTYHSYGQYVLYGWGYDSKDPPNVNKLRQMANVGANAMKKENGGSRYSVGGAAKLLYPASGTVHVVIHRVQHFLSYLSFKVKP